MRMNWKIFFIRIRHWEYWNSNIVYLPILPYLLYLFVKARHCFFFNAANPGIAYGGFLMESKWDIYTNAPAGFFPKTILVKKGNAFEDITPSVISQFQFPFIAKPDIGSKGRGVTLINNLQELELYHAGCPLDYIIQEKINYPLEAGIFYKRKPDKDTGILTGIAEKKYIQVTGDGMLTIRQLLKKQERYLLQMPELENTIDEDLMNNILEREQSYTVLEIGNHARGAMFLDASNRIDTELTGVIDDMCKQIKGFYFGRLDIRFESWEDLKAGQNFSIIELNGSGSEPTHIYDPSHSIFFAWKQICIHWKYIYENARLNHAKGIPYLTLSEGMRMFKNNSMVDKLLARFKPIKQKRKPQPFTIYQRA
jgi:hypothetical protein